MKRDAHLRDLSVDHHHALVLARRATRAAAGEGDETVAEVWAAVQLAFARELEPHFRVEELTLLPPLAEVGETDHVARVLEDHRRLRNMIDGSAADGSATDGGAASGTALAEFGKLMSEHVHFEERELFPLAERKLSQEILATVAAASTVLHRSDPPKPD